MWPGWTSRTFRSLDEVESRADLVTGHFLNQKCSSCGKWLVPCFKGWLIQAGLRDGRHWGLGVSSHAGLHGGLSILPECQHFRWLGCIPQWSAWILLASQTQVHFHTAILSGSQGNFFFSFPDVFLPKDLQYGLGMEQISLALKY